MEMTVRDWFEQRSFHHRDFSRLAVSGPAVRHPAVTLILPAREVAATIGPILDTVARMNEHSGLIDQVLVVDADSADGTADIARARGAEVYSENALMPEYGPVQGKGDSTSVVPEGLTMALARPWLIATAAAASAALTLAPAVSANAQSATGARPATVTGALPASRACPPAGFAVSFSATQFTRVLNLLVKLP
jgi:glycosyltransferase involved in cell wall biosynthesis